MYLIFSGECYYPSGGANDYIAQKDTLEDAKNTAKELIGKTLTYSDGINCTAEWSHIMNTKTGLIVAKFGESPYGYKKQVVEIR